MNILLINGHPDERAWYEERIRLLGHDVVACSTGRVALDHCRQRFYPCIVADHALSDMAVEDLCRHIRLLPQEKRSMLLLLAGPDDTERLRRVLETGVDDYLIKPVDGDTLMMRIGIMERRVKHEHAMEVLRVAQTYAGNIVDSSLDMIIAVDLKRHIVEFNRAAQYAFGYRLEEVLGKHVDMLYADASEAAGISHATLEHGVCVREILNTRKNGEVFPCLLSASILHDAYGNPIGIMGISRDITNRKQAEAELERARDELAEQNQALARASQLKDEFLSLISHELRTPLTVILSQSELLKERLYGGLTDTQRQAIESIEQNGQRLLTLINDMLDFSTITQGSFQMTTVPVDIETVCRDCLNSIRPLAESANLSVSERYDGDFGYVQADEHLLKQAIMQLLNNAVKFTDTSGAIGLELHGDMARQQVQLAVWDTGIGIAPEKISHLFQPFVQLDSGLTREYLGAGFGLALAAHIVNLHAGQIDVESAEGHGSRFTITLPWRETHAK